MEMLPGEIKKTIVINAPASVVFKALTDENDLIKWMPSEAKMDARIGGAYEFKYHWAERNVDSTTRGEILELIPNRKLSYTWDSSRRTEIETSSSPLQSSIVTWTLEELSKTKTRVTLTHRGIAREMSQDSDRGWTHFIAQLARYSEEQASAGNMPK